MKRYENRIVKLLDIKYPILQGGMAWVADAELAAAVSNAGGLGIIAAANVPPKLLEKELLKVRSLTDKPFGLNIMLLSETAPDAIELAAAYKVPVVTTGAGLPGKVIDRLKPLGIKIIPVVASAALGERVEKQGADAVIAEGMESGGHIGEITTMVLVPRVADFVSIPVIAAGGIADGRGIVAAFALGADGVQLGTRFVCASECNAHAKYKEAIIKASERSTVVTGRSTGHPVRSMKNKFTNKFEELENKHASIDEIEAFGSGKLRAAVADGDMEWGSVMAGQSASMVQKVMPAAEIIKDLFEDAARRFEYMSALHDYFDNKISGGDTF